MSQKRADRLAAFVLFMIVITMIGAIAGRLFPVLFPSVNEVLVSYQVKTIAAVLAFATATVQVGSGVWLYAQASRQSRPRWVWAILGLAGGVLSLVLWFLVELIRKVEALSREGGEEMPNTALKNDLGDASGPSAS